MKNLFALLMGSLIISGVGCIKPSTTNTTITTSTGAPDVTGLTLSAPSTYIPGSTVTVDVTAPKVANGTYTFYYQINSQYPSGNNSGSSAITFANGKGSFTTIPLSSAYGCITIAGVNLQNTNNAFSSAVTNANTSTCDSSGVMDAMYNNTKFYSTDVTATLNGSTLQINGSIYDGSSYYSAARTIQLTVQQFAQAPKTVSFSYSDYWDKGMASYSSTTNNQNASYGKITITATSPILSGNFTFTTQDSSKFSGTFSVKAP